MENIFREAEEWFKKNNISYCEETVRSAEENYFGAKERPLEQNGFIVMVGYMLESSNVYYTTQHYSSPDVYLKEIIRSILRLSGENNYLVSITSNDKWETADVTVSLSGNIKQYHIPDVEKGEGGWIRGGMNCALRIFSRENLPKVFHRLWTDDSNVFLYISDDDFEELQEIRRKLPEPEWGLEELDRYKQ